MTEQLVKAFNALPCSPRTPSGRVPNEWHFDLRYIHHEPCPSFFLWMLQPDSRVDHMQSIPLHLNTSLDGSAMGLEFFPERPTDAAPTIVKALLHIFVNNAHVHNVDTPPPPIAPWQLTTNNKSLADAVGTHLRQLGVHPAHLCNVGISTARTMGISKALFGTKLQDIFRKQGRYCLIDAPGPIIFLEKDVEMPVPARPANLEGDALYAWMSRQYHAILARGVPPDGGPYYGPASLVKEHESLVRIQRLLKNHNEQALLSKSGLGDPNAALDYGIRLSLGLGCKPSRKRSRKYLLQVTGTKTASDEMRAIAHGLLIFWYMEVARTQLLPRHFLYAAFHHANQAAALCRSVSPPGSLSSPAVLWLHDTASEVERHRNTFSDFGRGLYPYVHLARKERAAQMYRLRDESIERRHSYPHWYRCAAANCTIEADTSAALSRCAGLCDKEMKPRYCSWQCQRADWETHKPFCCPGTETSVRKTGTLIQMDPVLPHPMGQTFDGTLSIFCQHPRSKYLLSLSTATMTSAQIKALKEVTEAPAMAEEKLMRHVPWVSTYLTR